MTGARSQKQHLKDTVSSMLASLGSDQDEVARSLMEIGIKGRRGSPTDCAVARYLRQRTEADPSVGSVIVRVNWVRIHGTGRWGVGTRVKVPPAVRGFISGFDRYRYPDLIGGPRRSATPSSSSSSLSHPAVREPAVSGSLVVADDAGVVPDGVGIGAGETRELTGAGVSP